MKDLPMRSERQRNRVLDGEGILVGNEAAIAVSQMLHRNLTIFDEWGYLI